jgi:hypothetical protein
MAPPGQRAPSRSDARSRPPHAPAQAGGHAQQIRAASTLHIPPIEAQMEDGTNGIQQRDFYPVTAVPVLAPIGVGRSATV